MRLYRTEAERELLPEEDLEFVTSTLADDEFLLIVGRDDVGVVSAAIIESCQALTDAEFTRKFGFPEEQAWQLRRRIWDTIGSARRDKPREEPPSSDERQSGTSMKIYCGQDEFEQLEEHKRHLYGKSADVDSNLEVLVVSIGELETFASLVAFSLEVVDEREYDNRLDVTPEYARSAVRQMEQILQELREREA